MRNKNTFPKKLKHISPETNTISEKQEMFPKKQKNVLGEMKNILQEIEKKFKTIGKCRSAYRKIHVNLQAVPGDEYSVKYGYTIMSQKAEAIHHRCKNYKKIYMYQTATNRKQSNWNENAGSKLCN